MSLQLIITNLITRSVNGRDAARPMIVLRLLLRAAGARGDLADGAEMVGQVHDAAEHAGEFDVGDLARGVQYVQLAIGFVM